MSNTAPLPDAPASQTADPPPDPAVARAERRLRLLEELAEIGMELARALKPGAPAGGASEVGASGDAATEAGRAKGREPADAYGPLSRAIRLTLALEARTDAELRDLKAGLTRMRAAEQARAVEHARIAAARDSEARTERIRDLVLSVADAEMADIESLHDLHEALDERLDEDDAYIDRDRRPLRETVERLCKDLSLTPDWSRWAGEGWIDDDAPARSRFSPFNQPSARPVLDLGPPPALALVPSQRFNPGQDLE